MSKYIRSDIIKVFTASGVECEKARKLTGAIIEAMTAALAYGAVIDLRGFGTLEVKERKTYSARNPKTGESVTVPSHRRVIFRPGRELKAALKSKK